jgi:hypothetical protein
VFHDVVRQRGVNASYAFSMIAIDPGSFRHGYRPWADAWVINRWADVAASAQRFAGVAEDLPRQSDRSGCTTTFR